MFTFYLEKNLHSLYQDLQNDTYKHGPYKTFTVTDNKKRLISVASIRDRVVHRLLYEYLVPIYDKTFIYDAWSCRKGKGLLGAIVRAQKFLASHPNNFVWRTDITKFFDNVDPAILPSLLKRRIKDERALAILEIVIANHDTRERERERVKCRPRKLVYQSEISRAKFLPIFISTNWIDL